MNSSDDSGANWPLSHQRIDKQALQQLSDKLFADFLALLSEENIPADQSFTDTHKNLYIPFCAWLVTQQKASPLIIAINGSQGSGKSTLTRILKNILERGFNKTVVSLSIDDLYKTKRQREQLAQDVHPLFSTRGVPGTHDVDLGISVLTHLLEKQPAELLIPAFDKSTDDRLPESGWNKFKGQCDIVLFEGWCVGAISEDENALINPVNSLEKHEDEKAIWRSYVNQQLNNDYSKLFSLIDILILLKIPDFSKVFEWRKLQEEKLKASLDKNKTNKNNATMSDAEIDRFIMHYERITKHTLKEMPERCDIVFELADNHQISHVITRSDK